MNNTHIARQIGRQLTWLETWKQPRGYGGPVIHYWKNSTCYTGPGLDWRYEGIIVAYIRLFEKTNQETFLNRAREAGNHLVKGQLPQGQFVHSGFDGNPSGPIGSMPHDTAASIGLMRLAELLRSQNNPQWKEYYAAAKKNLAFHMKYLYDPSTGLFFQTFPSLDPRHHLVANKHATLAELLLLLYKMEKDKKQLRLAERCVQFVISQQDHGSYKGAIAQTNKNKSYISLYMARCVSGLMAIYEITKNPRYIESALETTEFLKKMAAPEGGFYFGWRDLSEGWYRYKYPQFVAGTGDILRAFVAVNPYKKYPLDKHLEWIDQYTHPHGGVWTSRGMDAKDTKTEKKDTKTEKIGKEPCCNDVIPVVGWNDKILRLRVELLKEKTTMPEQPFTSSRVVCHDGVYEEDKDKMVVTTNNKNYIADKHKAFACARWFFEPLFFMRAEKHLPPLIWEYLRRLGQWNDRKKPNQTIGI